MHGAFDIAAITVVFLLLLFASIREFSKVIYYRMRGAIVICDVPTLV